MLVSSRPAMTCSVRPAMLPAKTIRRISSGKQLYQSPKREPGDTKLQQSYDTTLLCPIQLRSWLGGIRLRRVFGIYVYSSSQPRHDRPRRDDWHKLLQIPRPKFPIPPQARAPRPRHLPPSVSQGLSSGAIAGIAIGSIAVAVAICLLIFLVWSHKRKNPQTTR